MRSCRPGRRRPVPPSRSRRASSCRRATLTRSSTDVTGAATIDATATATALEVRGLAKAFGATRALRSCSFALRAGEVHAIVGENGSAKSTLVKILTGVHHADAGEVLPAGEPPAHRHGT